MNYLVEFVRILKNNFIFCISVTGNFILHLIIAWQPLNRLEGFSLMYGKGPLIDDSYLIFKISKDLADWFAGHYPSFQLTSGFQPLIALLYTPFFQLFWNQKEFPIHCALSLNATLGIFAHLFLYGLLRKMASRTIATFLVSIWIWSPYVMNQTINGMETSLALLLLLITLRYYWQINSNSSVQPWSWCFLGLFIGLGFWARVDLGILGITIVLDQTWLAKSDDSYSRTLRMRNVLLCSLTALAVALPWIIFTFSRTGAILPISGKAVRQISSFALSGTYPNHPALGFIFEMLKYAQKEFFAYQPLAALSQNLSWQLFISSLSLTGIIIVMQDRNARFLLRSALIFQSMILASYIIFIGGWWHLNRYSIRYLP